MFNYNQYGLIKSQIGNMNTDKLRTSGIWKVMCFFACLMLLMPLSTRKVQANPIVNLYCETTSANAASPRLIAGKYSLSGNVTLSDNQVITISSNTTLDLKGHTITGVNGENVIEVKNGAELTLLNSGENGGLITHKAGEYGRGVSNNGTFNMYGGTISGNTLSGNNMGAGVYNTGTMTLSGNCIIDNNTSGGNVYLVSENKIRIEGELANSTRVGVTTETAPTDGNPVTFVNKNGHTVSDNFISDNTSFTVFIDENDVKLCAKSTVSWNSCSGNEILETDKNVVYGTKPQYNSETPSMDATSEYIYTFSGWADRPNQNTGVSVNKLPSVSRNTIYYATFSRTVRKYSVSVNKGVGIKSVSGNGEYEVYSQVSISATLADGYNSPKFSSDVTISDNKFKMPDKNVIISTSASANRYTVSYNGNGSTDGSMDSQKFTYGVSQNLAANSFDRSFTVTYEYNNATSGNSIRSKSVSASFNGWAESKGGARKYDDKAQVGNLTTSNNAIVTLYAKWEDGNVTLPSPSKAGHNFDGWYSDPLFKSKKVGAGGESYSPKANIELYAKWSAIRYRVKITPSGNMTLKADPGAVSQNVVIGNSMTDVIFCADEGYYFPENYNVSEVNGIRVTRVNNEKIHVSGVPTADTDIILIAPTAMPKEPKPDSVSFNATDSDKGKLTGLTVGSQYTVSGATPMVFTAESDSMDIENVSVGPLLIAKKGDGTTHNDSDPKEIVISKEEKPREGELTVSACTVSANNNGSINGLTDSMQYKKSDEKVWNEYTGVSVNRLTPGIYYVREKAHDTTLASENLILEVEAYAAVGQCSAPTFEPPAGEYTETISVSLNCKTDGANIYYKTVSPNAVEEEINYNNISANGTKYTSAISVSKNCVIYAYAQKDGKENSAIVEAAYTFVLPEHYITVENGTADKTKAREGETVTISANTAPEEKVFKEWETNDISLDEDKKNIPQIEFAMPSKNVTIKAIYKEKPTRNLEVTAPTFLPENYGYAQPEAKTIMIFNSGNSMATITSVSLNSAGAGAFTISPNGPVTVSADSANTTYTIRPNPGLPVGVHRADVIVNYDENEPARAEVSFEVKPLGQVEKPTFSPPGDLYYVPQNVSVSCNTPGASIYYTTDGTVPTTESRPYHWPDTITVSTNMIIKAIAVKDGMTDSETASEEYKIDLSGRVATPVFSPAAGTYVGAQSITISCNTARAVIHYTMDGTAPTASSTEYTGPIHLDGTKTIKAIAVRNGMTDSEVAVAAYTIKYTVTVNNGSGAGEYATGTTVTISANAPTEGKYFDKWESSGVTLATPSANRTTFSMPTNNVTVTAKYKDKTNSGITTRPVGKTDLVYSGTAQALVSAGTATGGILKYAVTETDSKPADTAYSATLPSKINAGKYYVWYKVFADEKHNDTEAVKTEVAIAKKTVSVNGLNADKKYDGNTTATLAATITGKYAADDLGVSAIASFEDSNVGDEKTVTYTGLALSGLSAANYSYTGGTTGTIKSKITQRPISVTAVDQTVKVNKKISVRVGGLSPLRVG